MSDGRRLNHGHVRVYMKTDSSYVLGLDQHDAVRAAWMAGKAFVDCVAFYGDTLTIKCAEIEAVGIITADSIEKKLYDDAEAAKELKARELLSGDA